MGILSAPLIAHAGFLSFLAEIFTGEKVAASAEENNVASPSLASIQILKSELLPDPDSSKGGAEIIIVNDNALVAENGPSGSLADIEGRESTSSEISIYVVREGDTLSAIAEMFEVSVNTIVWANDIQRGIVRPGQTLVILPVSGVRHTVKKGETLKSIAAKYKGDLEEIYDYNGVTADTALAVGDIVIIPDGEIVAVRTTSSSSTAKLRDVGGPVFEGYYMRPADGRKTQGLHGYNGIDIGGAVGDPVYAAADGEVIISRSGGWNGGYGNYIVLRHANGTQTLYAHNNKNLVSITDVVVKGQIIGLVGSTGKSTGPHLHFEIRGAKNPF